MNMLNISLVMFAGGAFLWGFNRYRTRFVKIDLLLAFVIGTGLLSIVFVPGVFDWIGTFFSLQRRIFTVLFLAVVFLLCCLLYVLTLVRELRNQISDLTRTLSVDDAALPIADGGRDTIAVIIPAYNEETTIETVVQSLPTSLRGYTITPIIVSDGSADATAERANIDGAMVVEHPLNQGQGGALKTGFEIADQMEAALVVTMDGDGQHPAAELERLVGPIITNEADYVMGSRHRGTDYSGNSATRRAGIRAFTWLINTLTRSSITDCTNGFRAIRGDELSKLTLTEERFSAPELIIEARKKGLRLKEIPITIEERQAGETKKPQLTYALGLARTILTTWIR
jgi:Ca2+/Na+ antiporter